MKKYFWLVLFFCFSLAFPLNAVAETKTFEGKGEIISADPLYGRVTIHHNAIKGFAGNEDTEFVVRSKDLLNNLGKHDLVDFSLEESGSNAEIVKINKTGVAPAVDAGLPVGKMAQDILVATGEAAKTVTTPIEPAHQMVTGAFGATTDATGTVLKDAKSEVKQKF